MQFDELCALVGALRDRVAELEAREAARAERDAKSIRLDGTSSLERWTHRMTISGAAGDRSIAEIAAAAVRRGLAQGGSES
jgi:hypothetical protein